MYRDILMFKEELRGHDAQQPIDNHILRKLADLVAKSFFEGTRELEEIKKQIEELTLQQGAIMAKFLEKPKVEEPKVEEKAEEKVENVQIDLPIWKKFPTPLKTFEVSHEFCKFMKFNKGRLSQIIGAYPERFKGTFNKVASKQGNRHAYWIEPDSFLLRLLEYPYRSAAERELLAQYKKENQEHDSRG